MTLTNIIFSFNRLLTWQSRVSINFSINDTLFCFLLYGLISMLYKDTKSPNTKPKPCKIQIPGHTNSLILHSHATHKYIAISLNFTNQIHLYKTHKFNKDFFFIFYISLSHNDYIYFIKYSAEFLLHFNITSYRYFHFHPPLQFIRSQFWSNHLRSCLI